ncbi:PPOX class F420-dependent oxidoreductase [Streptomyces sp. NA02950]|uniref:PPOX class F420-dependent oxidoreductase n=1 Tax=Streptomyces sp. NA02950 TaxID=2742137 RepID=UPI00158FD509|nr:PPOX class F420-dependent oxidoreductase [Streptomyces sp. NA02950]QKV94216.1 PPOX class F420-dependent oxidoreductase [Streptomyces sp. NA02950]
MATALSENLKRLLDSPVFIVVGTVQADGSPQMSPVWVKRDGDELLFSTTMGRQKQRNIDRDARVSVLVQPADSPYTYAEIRGTASYTTEGGNALIDELSLKYAGKKYAEFNPASAQDSERIVVRITPKRIVGSL